MKRHIVFPLNFDSRALLLDEINPEWEEGVRKLHEENYVRLIAGLKIELGTHNFEEKLTNFKELGPAPFSIIGYHNEFFRQCRYSFIHGFYYPALTSACALGERIFNHIILDLRENYKGKPSYRKVYNKGSFCDWGAAIDVLVEWNVFQHEEVEAEYRKLADIRHRSIHFNQSTYSQHRDEALIALNTVSKIISLQFGYPTIGHKWAIDGTVGHSFIKKEAEDDPFIKKYYLPQSPKVGYKFAMRMDNHGEWLFLDYHDYDGTTISDEEFAKLFNERDITEMVPTEPPLPTGIIVQKIVRS